MIELAPEVNIGPDHLPIWSSRLHNLILFQIIEEDGVARHHMAQEDISQDFNVQIIQAGTQFLLQLLKCFIGWCKKCQWRALCQGIQKICFLNQFNESGEVVVGQLLNNGATFRPL